MSMKIFVASDLHGSAIYCEKMLRAYDREQADRLLLLGDLLYHGPRNDLPEGYQPKQVLAMLNDTGDWTQRLSPEERKLYEKLSEFL